MMRYLAYIWYVLRHKWYVFRASIDLGVPLLGLMHDNSKFTPDESLPYARHFYNHDGSKRTRKASDGFYTDTPDDIVFDRAWLRHIQRNKHHPQHWVHIVFFECDCPRSVTMSGMYRLDVLLNDDGYARCVTCRFKGPIPYKMLVVEPMPERYIREMVADWQGAGMAQGTPDTLGWYRARGRNHVFHEATRMRVCVLLRTLNPI